MIERRGGPGVPPVQVVVSWYNLTLYWTRVPHLSVSSGYRKSTPSGQELPSFVVKGTFEGELVERSKFLGSLSWRSPTRTGSVSIRPDEGEST